MAGDQQELDELDTIMLLKVEEPVGYLEISSHFKIASDKKPNKFRLAMLKSLLGWTWTDK